MGVLKSLTLRSTAAATYRLLFLIEIAALSASGSMRQQQIGGMMGLSSEVSEWLTVRIEAFTRTHVTVIDVTATNSKHALKPNQTVVVMGNRIAAVGRKPHGRNRCLSPSICLS